MCGTGGKGVSPSPPPGGPTFCLPCPTAKCGVSWLPGPRRSNTFRVSELWVGSVESITIQPLASAQGWRWCTQKGSASPPV